MIILQLGFLVLGGLFPLPFPDFSPVVLGAFFSPLDFFLAMILNLKMISTLLKDFRE